MVVLRGSMATIPAHDTSGPDSKPGKGSTLVGGYGFESYNNQALVEVVPVLMLVLPYVTGMHGAGGGQSTYVSTW